MKFYRLEPEVAGGLGPDTVMDRSIAPPRVERLHYEFDGWSGDQLLESFPCFIVTESLAKEIGHMSPTGVELANVKITKSSQFEELYPGKSLPEFRWLKIFGTPGRDDFGISGDYRLVVSERILNLLKRFGLSHCDIADRTSNDQDGANSNAG